MNYIDLAYELKTILESDERIILLNKYEEEMNNDKEVLALAKNKEEKQKLLERSFENNQNYSGESRKELLDFFNASNALDEHPLVKRYNKQYSIVSVLLEEIHLILFGDLLGESCHANSGR